jgi:ABC-type transport system involved in multi-copper enzyme maturation permease subunit
MVGPVLFQELLLGGRRNQFHVFRWVYAAWLITQLIYFYMAFQGEELQRSRFGMGERVNRASGPEVVGGRFAEAYVRQQMLLLVLVTPAFVAGAVTDEKRRGTLQYLLLTDLETRHIVLGKLLGRVAQVALVGLGGLPLFALLAGFGGVEPLSLLAAGAVLVVPLFGLGAATLLASVWCRQTRDAVLALYVAGGAGVLLVYLLGGPLDYLNPTYVLAPAWGPSTLRDLPEAGRRLLWSVACWGVVGGACVGLAIWRLRPVYVRELESVRPGGRSWYSAERVPVSDEPVRWRERHVEGLAPNPTLRRVPQGLGVALVSTLTTASSLFILWYSLPRGTTVSALLRPLMALNLPRAAALLPDAATGFLIQGVVALLLATLVVGIRCSGSVTGERERQTWEAVLLTPLSAKHMVRGKLWGVLSASGWYVLAYAAPAVALSVLGGVTALLATLLCLAITILGMYFIGAAGIWCSVRSRNSWRALLGTMAAGYVGGALVWVVTSPAMLLVYLLLLLVLTILDFFLGTGMARAFGGSFGIFFVASCIALALIFWLTSRLFINRSVRWIADRERTRHWYDEPVYRRPRREPLPPRLARGR